MEEGEVYMVGSYNRYVSKKKAIRKRRISNEVCSWGSSEYYDNLHQYSKNKIHCSCHYCQSKTRNKGRRRQRHANYTRHLNYRHSELIRQLDMDDQLKEMGYTIPRKYIKE